MIVVADTSPLNYLIQIECDGLLPELYGKIEVPAGVLRELHHPSAPRQVAEWLNHQPDWLQIQSPAAAPDESLAFPGLGEREAIQIAVERAADLILIDERRGRVEAQRRGLRTTGTLGVLLDAGELGLIDPRPVYRRLLSTTSFRVSSALEAQFLRQAGAFRL